MQDTKKVRLVLLPDGTTATLPLTSTALPFSLLRVSPLVAIVSVPTDDTTTHYIIIHPRRQMRYQ